MTEASSSRKHQKRYETGLWEFDETIYAKISEETEDKKTNVRKKTNRPKKSVKFVEPEPIDKPSNDRNYSAKNKMTEASSSRTQPKKYESDIPEFDETIYAKKSEKTEDKKTNVRKKTNRPKKSVKFVEPEPIDKPSIDKMYSANDKMTEASSSRTHQKRYETGIWEFDETIYAKKSEETKDKKTNVRKKTNRPKKSVKFVEPEPIDKPSNDRNYSSKDKTTEASTSRTRQKRYETGIWEFDETIYAKKFEETEDKKTNVRKKTNRPKKSMKFVEPEPIDKPSNDRNYSSKVFVSNRLQYFKKLDKLTREIYDTIRETDGVWCTEVVALYCQRYGQFPDFTRFRFMSILQLLLYMKDQLEITLSEGNYWICDAKAPHPPPKKPEPKPEPEPEPEPSEPDIPWWDPCPPEPPDCSAILEDALPGVPFAPDVFPVDCIQPGETIPSVDLPAPYHHLKVFITAFYSPSHLWLRLLGSNKCENMIDEMTAYYKDGEGARRRLADAAMRVGYYCAALFYECWHRAVIVRIVDTEHAKVLLVDQGLVLKLSIYEMKPLRRQWAQALPAQAVRARLAGVRPPNGAQIWPRFSIYRFADQARGHLVIAYVLAVDNAERSIQVKLSNPSTKERIKRKLVITEGIDHGTELIKAGYAEPETRSSLENGERFSYYYPLFDVLESGATPSFIELEFLAEQGFEPEDVPSFLKHVPPLEPIRCPTPPHLAADCEAYTFIDPVTSDPVKPDPGHVTSLPVTLDPLTSLPTTLDSLTLDPCPVLSSPVTLKPDPVASLDVCHVTSDPVTLGPLKLDPVTAAPEASDQMTLNLKKSATPVTQFIVCRKTYIKVKSRKAATK